MTAWLIAALAGIAAAALSYVRLRAPSGGVRVLLGALRAAALAILIALLLDAPLGRPRIAAPSVFVDGSLSMSREGAPLTSLAWDSANAAGGDSVWIFGDSVRPGAASDTPTDGNSRVRPVVERTMASGRPAVIITDGEVQDSTALDGLVSGSRVIVLARPGRPDAALVTMEAPRAAV